MNGHPTRDGWFSAGQVPCDPVPPPREHPYRVVLLGPPGVGKGTQAMLLGQTLRACHLSTGDLFRAASCGSELSPSMRAAIAATQRGELVCEELVIDLVRERAGCLRCHGGFLLDGFPRNVTQAQALDELLAELNVTLDAVLYFELPQEEIVARLAGRRTCSRCPAVYHLAARPPATAGVCDGCGGELTQRADDRPDVIRVRMQAYDESTRPLIDFYRRDGRLVSVAATGTPEQIRDRAMRLLDRRVGASQAVAQSV